MFIRRNVDIESRAEHEISLWTLFLRETKHRIIIPLRHLFQVVQFVHLAQDLPIFSNKKLYKPCNGVKCTLLAAMPPNAPYTLKIFYPALDLFIAETYGIKSYMIHNSYTNIYTNLLLNFFSPFTF